MHVRTPTRKPKAFAAGVKTFTFALMESLSMTSVKTDTSRAEADLKKGHQLIAHNDWFSKQKASGQFKIPCFISNISISFPLHRQRRVGHLGHYMYEVSKTFHAYMTYESKGPYNRDQDLCTCNTPLSLSMPHHSQIATGAKVMLRKLRRPVLTALKKKNSAGHWVGIRLLEVEGRPNDIVLNP